MAVALLDNVNANGSGDWVAWPGGSADIFITATDFGGGNVTIQRSTNRGVTAVPAKFTNGDEFIATENGSFYATGWGQGTYVRATLAGATDPVAVRVTA